MSLICIWIASQARNDEQNIPSLRGGTTKQSGNKYPILVTLPFGGGAGGVG
jgi:hypothetical protein